MIVDKTCPPVPFEVFCLSGEDPDLEYDGTVSECWNAILLEFLDPEHSTRSHHNVGTYDKGCRGPLCAKANREHPRRRAGRTTSVYALRQERIFDPVLDYFHVIAKHRFRIARHAQQIETKENAS